MTQRATNQTYENHRRFDYLFMSLGVVFLAALVLACVDVIRSFNPTSLALAILMPALIALWFRVRSYAIVVQDRVIRLEMQLRLARLLQGDLAEKALSLGPSELVALRFASDSELPELARRLIEGELKRPDDVKRAIRDWQGDDLRV